jgi:signal transduction histidine kinase
VNSVTDKLNFRVSSALKSVIGRDLITNDFVAIFELVKNSFDAGATKVDIIFQLTDTENCKIYVVDNGKGMTFDDLVNKWLFVAYSAKEDGSEDKGDNRVYAGNKGVGRFSCDRLGGNLKLQTRTKSTGSIEEVKVNWGEFEKNSKMLFENIEVNHSNNDDFDIPIEILSLKNGVILEVSNLRDQKSWDRPKLLRLKRHLAKLINPFGDLTSRIDLKLHCSREFIQDEKEAARASDENFVEVVNGSINNLIFETLKEKTTWMQVSINLDGYFYSTLIDRGALIYKIRESSNRYPQLADSEFNCQLFYLNKSAKITFGRRMLVSAPEFGSLFLFRNGFRVYPVGESGDDFWRIDRRRQQGFARFLGNRDLMGRVDISGPETKFKEASSRDKGLVETLASRQLHDCVWDLCIKRLENYVVGVTWRDKLDKEYETPKRMGLDENRSKIIELVESLAKSKSIELLEYNQDLINVLSEKSIYFEASIEKLEGLASGINNDDLAKNISKARLRFHELKLAEKEALRLADEEANARRNAEKSALDEKIQRIAAQEKAESISKNFEDEKKRNLFLVATGSRDKEQLESFLHQIIIYASFGKQKISSTLKKINEGRDNFTMNDVAISLSDLLEITEKLITTSRFATFANFKLDSAEIKEDICFYMEQYLEKISAAYNHRIDIRTKVNSKPFVMKFTPIELGMVLDNIVNNARKAKSSQVNFEFNSSGSGVLEIIITDDGKGFDKEITDKERIFEKGFTTTRGSGLGLFHSRRQVEKMGGELVLPSDQPEKGFELVMRFRKL